MVVSALIKISCLQVAKYTYIKDGVLLVNCSCRLEIICPIMKNVRSKAELWFHTSWEQNVPQWLLSVTTALRINVTANLNDGIPVECVFAFENLRLARLGASGVDRTQYLCLAPVTSIPSYSNPLITLLHSPDSSLPSLSLSQNVLSGALLLWVHLSLA